MNEVAVCTKCLQEFHLSDDNDLANISNIDVHGECNKCAMEDKE